MILCIFPKTLVETLYFALFRSRVPKYTAALSLESQSPAPDAFWFEVTLVSAKLGAFFGEIWLWAANRNLVQGVSGLGFEF